MNITATKLRKNLYNILDQVIDNGQIIEIHRKGHIIRIVPDKIQSRFEALEPHTDIVNGDPQGIVNLDWSNKWEAENNL